MKLLIVEDNLDFSKAIAHQLEEDGYTVDLCDNGLDAMYHIEQGLYDLIVLDRMLPELDGLTLLNMIRNKGISTPVIMATALHSLNDKIDGLDAGADDYITKPFETEELKARIRALLRRPHGIEENNLLTFKNLTLDTNALLLKATSTQTINLSQKEALLLEFFFTHPNQTLTRDQIFIRLWGIDAEVEESNVDTYIYLVRRRIKAISENIKIKTIYGIGYRIELEDSHA